MSERNLIILTKIILIYSIFLIGVKIFILFQGAWLVPNLLLMMPFVILALIAGMMIRKKEYSWYFALAGALVIILIRAYETRLVVWFQQQLAG